MPVTVEKSALLDAMDFVSVVIKSPNTIPILDNVKIDMDGMILRITGANAYMQAETTTFASGMKWSGCIPAKKLHDIAKSAREGSQVTFDHTESEVVVSTGRSKFKLPFSDPAEFPSFPDFDGLTFQMPADTMLDMLGKAIKCVDRDSPVDELTGLNLRVDGSVLRITGTDRYVYAQIEVPIPEGAEKMPSIVLPVESANIVNKKADGQMTISVSERMATFSWGNAIFRTKLIDREYPDMVQHLPKRTDISFEFDQDDMKQSLKRVMVAVDGALDKLWLYSGEDENEVRLMCRGVISKAMAEDFFEAATIGTFTKGFMPTRMEKIIDACGKGGIRFTAGVGHDFFYLIPMDREDEVYGIAGVNGLAPDR